MVIRGRGKRIAALSPTVKEASLGVDDWTDMTSVGGRKMDDDWRECTEMIQIEFLPDRMNVNGRVLEAPGYFISLSFISPQDISSLYMCLLSSFFSFVFPPCFLFL